MLCVVEDLVVGDEAPVGGVAQVIGDEVKVIGVTVGVHGEEGREKDSEVREKIKGEVEQLRDNRTCAWCEDGMPNSKDLSQCVCDTCVMKDKTSNSVLACSDLAHVVLVLVRGVTVVIVHIGLEDVLVVIFFYVAIFVRDLLYQEMFSLHIPSVTVDCVDCNRYNHDKFCIQFVAEIHTTNEQLVH